MLQSDEKINKVLYWIIKIGVFFILFLPVVVGSVFFFPFIVLKNTLFRIIVEIIFLLYIILVLRDARYRPKINTLSLAVLIFIVIVTITSFTGIHLERSLWGNYERMGGLVQYWHMLLFFIVLISVFRKKEDWNDFFTFSLFVSILMSFLALAQKFQVDFILGSSGGERLSATIGNPTYLAAYLLFNIFFIGYFFFNPQMLSLPLLRYSLFGLDVYVILHDLNNLLFTKQGVVIFQQITNNKYFFLAIFLFHILTYGTYAVKYLKKPATPVTTKSADIGNIHENSKGKRVSLVPVIRNFFTSYSFAVKILLLILFLLEFFIFFWTQTRGAIVGLYISLFVISFLGIFFLNSKFYKKIALIIFVVFILLPISIYLGKNTSLVKGNSTLNRLASISLENITTQSRLLTWKASWKGWSDDPLRFIIGYGQENYSYVFNKYFPEQIYKDSGSQIWFDRAHNIFFDIGITAGLIGLISYLSIFAISFYMLWINFKNEKKFSQSFLFIGLLIAYFFQNFFVFDIFDTLLLFILSVAFIATIKDIWKEQTSGEKGIVYKALLQIQSVKILPFIFMSVAFLLGVFIIYQYNIKLLKANNYLYKAITSTKAKSNLQETQEIYKKAIESSITGRFETREQLANYMLDLVRSKEKSREEIMPIYNLTLEELSKSVQEEPLNVRNYLYLSNVYNIATSLRISNVGSVLGVTYPTSTSNSVTPSAPINIQDEVIEVLKKAEQLSPTRPQIYFSLGYAYLVKNEVENAKAAYQKGLSLSSKVVEAHMETAATYISYGLYDEAESLLQYIQNDLKHEFSENEILFLIPLYQSHKKKQYDTIADFYLQLIKINPSNLKYYALLANTYAKMGKNSEAKDIAEQAVQKNPSLQDQIDKFLELLEKGELREKEN